ncbi:MAG: hypothetical protein LBN98_02125, partial [Prevotellaceae bacterium]|nr:hypothetical protein [Prevotellaceae bacterium]
LYVRSAAGCTASLANAAAVTVNSVPTGLSLAASPAAACAGQSSTLTASAAGAAAYSLNGATWQPANTFNVIPTATTNYTLYVRSAAGCTASLANAAAVTVNSLPTGLSLTANPTAVCAGQSATLTASAAGAAAYSLNGATWQSANTFNITPTATTNYALYVRSAAGCTASLANAAAVTVNSAPATPTSPVPATRCGAGNVDIGATVPGGVAVDWYSTASGGTPFATDAATITVSATNTASYYAQARNTSTGCVSAARLEVTVTINPGVAQATISGSSSNSCPATTVALTATASGATTFTWYRNGSQVQKSTSSAYTASSAGTYTVKGENANCTGATSSGKAVTIKNPCGTAVPGCPTVGLYQTTAQTDGNGSWTAANTYCTSRGARLPNITELQCMFTNRSGISGGLNGRNWSATTCVSSGHGDGRYYIFPDQGMQTGCSPYDQNQMPYRCVY